ncbi:MAG TPA: DMT family transporter [Hyphomicrobiaceae bacterium]|nr:DMT family transporter [Hyphomicrobiaceae bacterium]
MTEQHPFAPVKPSLATPPAATQGTPVLGMLLLVAAMLLIPVMDGIAKFLTGALPPLQVVWARYFFHLLLLLPLVLWRHGRRTFRIARPGMQLFRGSALLFSTCCFFAAVKHMPLADTLAVLFVYPFIVTALSPWLLGDRVGAFRWAAVSVGFVGALIIIRPGFQTLTGGTLLALGAGIGYAVYVLSTRRLRGTDPALVTLAWTGVVGTLVMTAILPLIWQTPTMTELALLILIGGLAAIGHYMIILAYEYASAPQLAPFGYVEIVSATIVGYVMFRDFPDGLTWAGIAIIVASGIFIAWREAKRGVVK